MNKDIQAKLLIKKRMPDAAPWIYLLLKEVMSHPEIELYLLIPHSFLSVPIQYIEDRNVKFYFFKNGLNLPGNILFQNILNYICNKSRVKYLVNKIQPDIINLHGVENAYYSSTILRLNNYPILITIQGLVSLDPKSSNDLFKKYINYKRKKIENKLLKNFTNFGIRVKFLEKHISELNNNAKFYWFKYPFGDNEVISQVNEVNKEFDFIFLGRVTKEKGIEDLIDALAIIKNDIPNVSLKVFGPVRKKYKYFLVNKINKYNLSNNIIFKGYIQDTLELYKEVSKGRVYVLPTYNDVLPGSIIESIKLGIPVIAYSANGVVDFNANDDVIKLVELGNVGKLAYEMKVLLSNREEQLKMIKKGKKMIERDFDIKKEFNKLLNAYFEILENK